MFRYPELDCWQTMLKRLYKKELEQVVLWFEEYRHALQQELEQYNYENSVGLKSSGNNVGLSSVDKSAGLKYVGNSTIKKTEV